MTTFAAESKNNFIAGQTLEVDINEPGQVVVGRLQPPNDYHGKLPCTLAKITATADGARCRSFSQYPTPKADSSSIRCRRAITYCTSCSIRRMSNSSRMEPVTIKTNPPAQPLDLEILDQAEEQLGASVECPAPQTDAANGAVRSMAAARKRAVA